VENRKGCQANTGEIVDIQMVLRVPENVDPTKKATVIYQLFANDRFFGEKFWASFFVRTQKPHRMLPKHALQHPKRVHGLGKKGRRGPCKPKARFIKDVTLADGMSVDPGVTLIKTWALKNTGGEGWPLSTKLAFSGGDVQPAIPVSQVIVPVALPEQTVEVSVPILIPNTPGKHRGEFQLWGDWNSYGPALFGNRLWVDLVVRDPKASDHQQ
jgi:hypothetical protein